MSGEPLIFFLFLLFLLFEASVVLLCPLILVEVDFLILINYWQYGTEGFKGEVGDLGSIHSILIMYCNVRGV